MDQLRWVVTGCNGYLGRSLCLLEQARRPLLAIARAGRNVSDLRERGIVCHNYEQMPSLLGDRDVVIHCAGRTGTAGRWEEFHKINVEWTAELYRQAAEKGVAAFVYVSSIAALGYRNRPGHGTLSETDPPRLLAGELYGRSKLLAEQTLQELAAKGGPRLIIVRPGLIYGGPAATVRVMDQAVEICPSQRVPLVHVENFAEALAKLSDAGCEGLFHVVDSEQPELHELNELKRSLGLLKHPARRMNTVKFLMLTAARAAKRLWRPRGMLRAEWAFQHRSSLYTTEALREATGWTPRVTLCQGWEDLAARKLPKGTCQPVHRVGAFARLRRRVSMLGHIFDRLTGGPARRAHAGEIGVALVGVGGWGAVNADALMRTDCFHVAGVFDARADVAARFAARHRVRQFADYAEALACPDVQAVALTVPNALHVEMVQAAADAGKHVFVEKPLASTAELCRQLGRHCKEKGVSLLVGHQVRRDPAIRQMKRMIDAGELGQVLLARGLRTASPPPEGSWRRDPAACPGGSMEQLGIHFVDAMVHLLGLPLSCEGRCRNIPWRGDGPEWGHVRMDFAGGVRGKVFSSYSAPPAMRLELIATEGIVVYDGQSLTLRADGRSRRVPLTGPGGSIAQFHEFADRIAGKQLPGDEAETAAAVMEVVASMVQEDTAR